MNHLRPRVLEMESDMGMISVDVLMKKTLESQSSEMITMLADSGAVVFGEPSDANIPRRDHTSSGRTRA